VRAADQWAQIRSDLETLGGYYRITPNWTGDIVSNSGSPSGYYVSNSEMQNLLVRLRQHSSAFRQSFDRWSRYNRYSQTGSVVNISQSLTDYERALLDLDRGVSDRYSVSIDAVLRPAAAINSFITANRTNNNVSNQWSLVRSDLDTLASYYRVSWDWNNNPVEPVGSNSYDDFDSRITGTYHLNESRSDNVTTAIDQAMRNASYDATTRERATRMLERRLRSPQTLAIEKIGQQITMSSENAASVAFVADGVVRTETSPRGRIVKTSVTTTGNTLTINYEGDRTNDYYVTFRPTGNELRVTRRVYLENQNQTVTVTSVYDKTSPTPQWNTAPVYPGDAGVGNINDYVVPNNTGIVAILDTPLSTLTVCDGDRFSMTVNSPSQYSGAVIEGRAFGQRSGTITGRANMSLSFDTIRLRDGGTYRFAGIVDQVREPDGDVITVNNEGTIRDNSQTTRTVTRAGVGALLGAIIGAVAGGGEGAAIGAAVGAGAGAGSVVLQGRDNLNLQSGTQFTITATAPANVITP